MEHEQRAIRIAYIIDKLALHGTQKMLVLLARHLAQRQYEQRVYCLKDDVHPANRSALEACGIEIRRVGQHLDMGIGLGRVLMEWRRWKPDIVVTMLFYSDLIGRVLARIAAVPVLISLLRSSLEARNQEKHRIFLLLDRMTLQWVDTFVVNNTSVIPSLTQQARMKPERVAYIPNGVPRIHAGNRSITRQTLGLSENTHIIGTVGRLHMDKGCSYILRAFKQLRQQFPDSILLFVGSGELLGLLTPLTQQLGVADHVLFLGERTDVHELMACMDVYVQASMWEGMSNALMEAMALGKPVVATAVGGTLDLIEDGKTGWLIEPKRVDCLVEKLSYVLEHPKLALQVGDAAAQRIAQDFSVERMIDAYDVLFRNALAKVRQQEQ